MNASVTVKSGDVFAGIFFGAINENQEWAYLLKMVEQTKSNGKSELNGASDSPAGFVGKGADFAMSFDVKDVTDLAIEGISFDNEQKLQNGII